MIAAVSGGSDSTALLLLLARHLAPPASQTRLVAVTVDHRLRPESASEADAVATLAGQLGIEHRTLRWDGPKPAAGKAAAARSARYGLLAQAARSFDTDLVVTGHTADDQAETVAMRLQRGAGPGLAGMAPASLLDRDVWVLRPLLGTARQTLRDHLRRERVTWIDDPGNTDASTERARMRRDLTQPRRQALEALQAEWSRRRSALAHSAARLIERHAVMRQQGVVHIGPQWLEPAHRDAAVIGFAALLAVIGGRTIIPTVEKAAALLSRAESAPGRIALSRTLMVARRDGFWLARERRDLPPLGTDDIWDGRYRMAPDSATARPSGAIVHGLTEPPAAILAAARAAHPPTRPGTWAEPIMAPWVQVLSGFDLALASSIAGLIGAAPPPASPMSGGGTAP